MILDEEFEVSHSTKDRKYSRASEEPEPGSKTSFRSNIATLTLWGYGACVSTSFWNIWPTASTFRCAFSALTLTWPTICISWKLQWKRSSVLGTTSNWREKNLLSPAMVKISPQLVSSPTSIHQELPMQTPMGAKQVIKGGRLTSYETRTWKERSYGTQGSCCFCCLVMLMTEIQIFTEISWF